MLQKRTCMMLSEVEKLIKLCLAHICRGIRALFLRLAQAKNLAAQHSDAGETNTFGHYERSQ